MAMRYAAVAALLAAACGGTSESPGGAATSGGGASTTTGTGSTTTAGTGGSAPTGLIAHEWGTFTSVQSSLGETMVGLAHEDEPLPLFVYGRDDYAQGACMGCAKQLEFLPSGVTQKLETPVIYFYGDVAGVSVKVDFPKGIVSQWYPSAASFAPAVDPKKTGTPTQGSMSWTAALDPSLGDGDFPAVAATNIWAPSRHVKSLPLRVKGPAGNEAERFIFYRGVGAFDTALHIVSQNADTITIKNDSPQPIAAAILLRVHNPNGVLMGKAVPLGGIAPNGSLKDIILPFEGKELIPDYVDSAVKALKAALVSSGLSDDEAQAMVDTWDRSYFKMPGVRVLYIVPRAWTDALLPLQITPAPKDLVRTLVGRVEVLTLAEEANVQSLVKAYAAKTKTSADVLTALGRFAEAKLRRGAQLVKADAALAAACDDLVQQAAKAQ